MKKTAKPVTEVPFPAVTICGSGFHMNNVEKQVYEDFAAWRRDNGKDEIQPDRIKKDIADFMRVTFQIMQDDNNVEPVNIMDILDTMVASNVEASVASNAVSNNVAACAGDTGEPQTTTTTTTPTRTRKRRSVTSVKCDFQLDLFISKTALEKTEQVEDWKGIYDCSKETEAKMATMSSQ